MSDAASIVVEGCHSGLTGEFAAAFVAACGELADVDKGKTAKAGQYSYRYTDLAAVLDVTRPVLARHGLAAVQDVETIPNGTTVAVNVSTVVLHSSAGWYRSPVLALSAPPDPQKIGSAITYGRRYSLMATLGIAASDDDDAAATARPLGRATVLSSVRSEDEGQIRRLLAAASPDVRKHVQNQFRDEFGTTLAELPTDRHAEALTFVVNRLDPARLEADAAQGDLNLDSGDDG